MKRVSALDEVDAKVSVFDRAEQLQAAAASVGFDWPDLAAVQDKLHEEVAELAAALQSGDSAAIEDEAGDVLFALINLLRKAGLNPASALASTNGKFTRRFQAMEQAAWSEGSDLSREPLARQLARYRLAKAECLDH
ncbi:hypothetical protein A9404_05970 [Halothiobacillus diazotrophicus]|uniref:NTP pyrophosphohydrolase MazG-like domain-containing protein n=1 Tax=Halothiobacillus diazotrophicus TaxID=1860122 RepID=A0A191ZGK4_9GAMM|nr:MazG nucleotide pyrophosphohydrolase domain-containing protein [Halothiobacillus diazotrophicus]ANJ66987.1 hypothetical protein A9404_05970 [Halothiobacillus diazotrophicus]